MINSQPPTQDRIPTNGTLLSWRFPLAKRLFQIITLVSVPAVLAASYYALDEGTYAYIAIYMAMLAAMLVIAFWKRVNDSVRMWGLIAIVYFIIILDFYTEGRGSLARSFIVLLAFLSAMLFGRRGAILSAVVGLVTMISFAYAYTARLLPDFQVGSLIVSGWISNIVIVVLLITIVTFSVNYLVREMSAFLIRAQQLNQIITAERASLEQMVAERTQAADVARIDAEMARHEAEAQAWFTRGQAQLFEKLRGEQTIEMLANNITSQLCHYLGAQTGAFFLVSGQRLKLTGRYAYVERPGQPFEFGFSDNLAGEAARDNRVITVTDIGADAPLVASALGNAKPNQLLIAPIATDGQVFGVVELATLSQFSGDHEAFLRRVSESIAIAFRTAQTRERIAAMLAESQRQAEELQTQEEELRAANEGKLQAQADEMKAKKANRRS